MPEFQNRYVLVELVNHDTAIALTWRGYVPSEVYRAALNQALDIARRHGIKSWISDIRKMRMLPAEDQAWVKETWIGQAVAAGCYQKQAVIMAEDIFGQAAARNILTALQDSEIETQFFHSLEEARAWLLPDPAQA